jgi:hypothetical protein
MGARVTTLLSTRGRKLALEIGKAIDNGDTRAVVALVDSYGLPPAERRNVAQSLFAASGVDVKFEYDRFDGAHVRDLPEVWRRGVTLTT